VDGLGGLVAIVENALNIVMIMGLNDIVKDARSWIKKKLPTKLKKKGHVATLDFYLCFSCL